MTTKYLHRLARSIILGSVSAATCYWRPASRLMLVSDSPKWVIGREMQELHRLAKKLSIRVVSPIFAGFTAKQSVFLGSHFDLLSNKRWLHSGHRLGAAYFHGKPGTGVQEFDHCFNVLCQEHARISRLQVSCRRMSSLVLSSGIDPDKVRRIPIGINPTFFSPATDEKRRQARKEFGVPYDAVVIGSFQKDGIGWGEGAEPKLIKGPDVFLKAVDLLRARVKEVFVVLSGPARGFVKTGLERLGIPYRHVFLPDYARIGRLYHTLDAYLVTSREEGGPKAVLESMASGIPLISTRVGQAEDLVSDGENGWLVDVEDAEGLAYSLEQSVADSNTRRSVIDSGVQTAALHTYDAQLPLWKSFFTDFVQ